MSKPATVNIYTAFYFGVFKGRPIPDCGFTARQVRQQIMEGYHDRDWKSLRKAGYSVARFKLVSMK